jgi:hypothetical protein
MSDTKTTNLRFPAETYEELRRRAASRGVAMAEVVREAVALYLGRAAESDELPFGSDPADALVGGFHAAVADESSAHDHYLYGWPKEEASETAGGHERPARALPGRRPPPSGRG